jgi:hypothetical protein
LGDDAGHSLTTGGDNIDIGNLGVAGESGTIRIGTAGAQTRTFIAGIFGVTASSGTAVFINSSGQLGTSTSSRRFKKEIKPMDQTSQAILCLKPVTFQYKSDTKGTAQFGLIAEEVAQVDPDLVVGDADGAPYTVRYEAVNAMLLNEFLKQHSKVEQQETAINQLEVTVAKQEATAAQQQKDFQSKLAQQQKEIQALTASLKEQTSQIQQVSAQLEMSKASPQVAVNAQ